jgi:hypothetical protein
MPQERSKARDTLLEAQLAFQRADAHLHAPTVTIENSADPQRLEAYRLWAIAAKKYSDALIQLNSLL